MINGIEELIKNNDVINLRVKLTNQIYADRWFNKPDFDESLNLIIENHIDIFEPTSNEFPLINKTNYTIENYKQAFYYLKNNFSKERLSELREIAQFLKQDKNKDINADHKPTKDSEKSKKNQKKDSDSSTKFWKKLRDWFAGSKDTKD